MKAEAARNYGTELCPFSIEQWSFAKGDNEGNIGAPFLSTWTIQTALILAAT